MLTGLQSKAFHWPQGPPEHSSSATGLGRAVQALSSATEPSPSRQLTYLIRVPFPQVTEHCVLEQNHVETLLESATRWTVTHFLWSCSFPLAPLLPLYLPESRTQIATGFVVHCACFSSLLGQPGEGDKMVIHSPRCEKGEKPVTFMSTHTFMVMAYKSRRTKNSNTSDLCVILRDIK